MPVEDIPAEDLDPHLTRPSGRRLTFAEGRLRPWIEWFGPGRLVAGATTVIVLVVIGWWLLRAPMPPTEAGLPQATAPPSSMTVALTTTTSATSTRIVVHVAGAVAAPGVYELAADARVEAALVAAGGAVDGADPGALNLAALLTDGGRIYIPLIGEAPPPTPGGSIVEAATGPLDLNQATAEQLDELPGVGPTTAAAIVEHRSTQGPFGSVDDLEAVRGIGPAKLEALRDLVRT